MQERIDRLEQWLTEKPWRGELVALAILTVLWVFFFWRALIGEVSLPEGDFSGQFVAFGAYQARRLLTGEMPLWNPYNYGGHPFLADTQSAVFYPPRLVTIALSGLLSGWSYTALQTEALAHFWLASVWMYLFGRTVTQSRLAGMVSGVTLAYGGYLTGYPPLQLAVLEAGIWLPLALLGIYKHQWWLAGLALGLSLLAGHPQTSLFFIYVIIAYSIYRAAQERQRPLPILLRVCGILAGGVGLAALQLLPGLEYLRLTTRSTMSYAEMAGGFPLSDLATFFIPNVLTVWSPLYSGIAGLTLAGWSVWRGERSARFWGVVALIALGISFGGGTVLYRLVYLLAPGFSWFRGQERAAYVIAHSLAILAGLGTANLLRAQGAVESATELGRALRVAMVITWAFALEVFLFQRAMPEAELFPLLKGAIFLGILVTLSWAVITWQSKVPSVAIWGTALITLVVFDLFSNTMATNWDPIPPSERRLLSPLATVALEDVGLFRVDGRLGLGENYGTMVGLQDIRGISPLRLATLERYLSLPQHRLHEVLAVKYVFTDWRELEVPSAILAETQDGLWTFYLHEIQEPTPRAWLTFRVMVTPDEEQTLEWLADPGFDIRQTVILPEEPTLSLPETPPAEWRAEVIAYAAEHIVIETESPADSVLVVSEMYYPGWQAQVDGQPATIWRADAGLRAISLEAGAHRVEMRYQPMSVYLGVAISLGMAITLTVFIYREARTRDTARSAH